LNRHPYISFYQAKAIYELRRKKGKLHQFGELKNLPEFTEDQLKKIEPYLSFE
jgi:DNA uptake protein ComE-like DNA-binding protein